MRRRELSAFTLRAIELTGGSAEFKDRARDKPTWDGRMWHFSRLRHEMHVLHEVAHWLLSPWRDEPNYGLGRDPDGGPRTAPFFAYVVDGRSESQRLRILAELDVDPELLAEVGEAPATELLARAAEQRLTREEELAAMLTVFLVRHAGQDWRAAERVCKFRELSTQRGDFGQLRFWWLAQEIAERGVDVNNPIPGLTGPGPAPNQGDTCSTSRRESSASRFSCSPPLSAYVHAEP